jgi:cytochrome c2
VRRKPLSETPAGVKTEDTLAWYQTVDTYEGEQQTFHWRHLVSDAAQALMNLKCNTCHQGHNGNKEVSSNSHERYRQSAMLKEVDPEICLMYHGAFDFKLMLGMAKPWEESRDVFNNNCMVCHTLFRTNAHDVNYLNKEVIEQAGIEDGEVCYGGRSWYRIPYPYARNPWPGMPLIVPDWAKDRPTASQPRFLVGQEETSQAAESAIKEEKK